MPLLFSCIGPGEAALVILVSNLVEWAWHKYPWYIQSFNIGAFFVTIYFTGLFYNWLNPDHTLLDFPGILSALAAMAVFTLVNHLMVGIVVWLARGENFAKSGIFDSLPLVIDYTLLSMGVSAAMVWTFSPLCSAAHAPAALFNLQHTARACPGTPDRAGPKDRPV